MTYLSLPLTPSADEAELKEKQSSGCEGHRYRLTLSKLQRFYLFGILRSNVSDVGARMCFGQGILPISENTI